MKTVIVDSFTDKAFRGNPAGVCLAEQPLSDEFMLQVAAELGFSETAFVSESSAEFGIRYFSPRMEIPLCGHATLAAAKVVFGSSDRDVITFRTSQGIELPVRRTDDGLSMQFPAYSTVPADAPDALMEALGISSIRNSVFNAETKILLLEIESTNDLRELSPDFPALTASHDGINGVLVTTDSTDDEYDFHSRYFWPWSGTNEDPVTGGTHTFLAPYWSTRLGKATLRSFQSSARTGFMTVEVTDDSVTIVGKAVVVLTGELEVPAT